MLKRPSEFSQSNIKDLPTASDTHRSLQSFCNYQSSTVSNQLSAIAAMAFRFSSLFLAGGRGLFFGGLTNQ
jgi:hypothetical protein